MLVNTERLLAAQSAENKWLTLNKTLLTSSLKFLEYYQREYGNILRAEKLGESLQNA